MGGAAGGVARIEHQASTVCWSASHDHRVAAGVDGVSDRAGGSQAHEASSVSSTPPAQCTRSRGKGRVVKGG